jgi:hypothetical protein
MAKLLSIRLIHDFTQRVFVLSKANLRTNQAKVVTELFACSFGIQDLG